MAKPAKKKSFEPMEQKIGQDKPRDMPTDGPARLDPQEIEVVDGPRWKEKAELLKFMDEPVTVMVHESADPNAEFIVEVWNGGRAQRFIRGEAITVKRKFIEVLARAKHARYRQEHYKDGNGNDAIRNIPSNSLRYPFSVLRDENPRGADWLRQILNEA